MDIAGKLAQEASVSVDVIPLPARKGDHWQRLDCPFCGHKRAVISYAAQWFECFSCEKRLSGYGGGADALAVNRFALPIDMAVS
jgi:ribosomal protein S27E